MAEILHQSSFTIGGIQPVTWASRDGTIQRRVAIEIRGVMVMNLDGAGAFVGELREAIRLTGQVE